MCDTSSPIVGPIGRVNWPTVVSTPDSATPTNPNPGEFAIEAASQTPRQERDTLSVSTPKKASCGRIRHLWESRTTPDLNSTNSVPPHQVCQIRQPRQRCNHLGAKPLFVTHYHELTTVGGEVPTVENVYVAADETDGEVTFLRTVRESETDRSYGIHIVDLTEMPDSVVDRSRDVLDRPRGDKRIPPFRE